MIHSVYIYHIMSALLKELSHGITHLFYPRLCEGCARPLLGAEQVLCISCSLELTETGYSSLTDNETGLRFAGRVPYTYATSYAYFTGDGLLQHLLHGLKYKNKKETGNYLGRKLGRSLKQGLDELGPDHLKVPIDLIIPVPLHKTKKAYRGYNQSMLIADGISDILNVPATDDLLLRTRNTESQTNKTRTERVNNMTDAFGLKHGVKLTGKHILLCDDVLTTGATIEACARTLLQDDTIKISIATIGIAIS